MIQMPVVLLNSVLIVQMNYMETKIGIPNLKKRIKTNKSLISCSIVTEYFVYKWFELNLNAVTGNRRAQSTENLGNPHMVYDVFSALKFQFNFISLWH